MLCSCNLTNVFISGMFLILLIDRKLLLCSYAWLYCSTYIVSWRQVYETIALKFSLCEGWTFILSEYMKEALANSIYKFWIIFNRNSNNIKHKVYSNLICKKRGRVVFVCIKCVLYPQMPNDDYICFNFSLYLKSMSFWINKFS